MKQRFKNYISYLKALYAKQPTYKKYVWLNGTKLELLKDTKSKTTISYDKIK